MTAQEREFIALLTKLHERDPAAARKFVREMKEAVDKKKAARP